MRGLPLAFLVSAVLWAAIIATFDAATGWRLVESVRTEFAAADPPSPSRGLLRAGR